VSAWLGMRELLVDRANQFDRNYIELIWEKTELAALRINSLQELGDTLQMMRSRRCLHRGRREHVAVEGLGKPGEQLCCCRLVPQDRRQRRVVTHPLQANRAHDFAVDQVLGKDHPANQGLRGAT